ncbi:phage N-6-adenine-methyltransferase [Latilactobacillus sakei]|uniref:phage N-6-adenine-methyltransferase n=1 Tax=Latilactobacillus sakei TaxID=1599 RepID=UPI000DC6476E|nr:phage N-6-adenine-methyltransferase [Latilactobacillus sakei]SPS04271.1 DNA N-6-adenine-methyltransferase (Dam) [Latilactobacillus sakei]
MKIKLVLDEKYKMLLDFVTTLKFDNSLSQDWAALKGNLWLNPPYGRDLKHWVKKAYESSINRSGLLIMLIPSRTDTSYWHDYIFNKAQIKFIR